MHGRLADRVDVPIGRAQLVVHHDAAAGADGETGGSGEFVARADAG